jgi:hypothetical protein
MRGRELILVAVAVALGGCPLGTTTTTTTTTLTAGRPIASSSEPPAAETAPEPGRIRGAIVRSQLESLWGLSPDEARQQLKKLGHDGNVSVGAVTDSGGGQSYRKDCGENKVCYTSGESGIGLHDDLTLFINPTLKIAPPPP